MQLFEDTPSPKNLKPAFEKILEQLNPAQKEAVETIEGPVLVIAGPGTGKTQILAARIGYILQQTDSLPENILCLTYTEAGTVAMRNRLFEFIGPNAYKVTIGTYHEFCNDVIQANLELFGLRHLDPISELEVVQLFRELIDGFSNDHPLKRWHGDPYYEWKRLKSLFSLMKTEDWSHEYICKKADQYLEGLADREDFRYKRANKKKGIKKGDINPRLIQKEADRMERLKAAANEYPKYQEKMKRMGRYDFDDMIIWVLNEFKQNKDLLLDYQEKYHYFLVDEYQDTNGSQNEILELLTGYWDVPNVFVVGDDDQSIFRFQGANVANIKRFHDTHRDHCKVVVIKENYRSSQNILDASKELINNNQERLIKIIEGLDKDLLARSEFAHVQVQPQIRSYYNKMHETVDIANEIILLKEKGIDLSEVAVIYRNHWQAEDLAKYLESKDVPINIKRRANILDSSFIKNICLILEYLEGESRSPHSREDLLFEILHFDFFKIEPLVIANMAMELRKKRGEKVYTPWRETISKAGAKAKGELFASDEDRSYLNIKRLSDDLEYWIQAVHNTTVQILIEKILTRGGVLNYVMRSPEKVWLMQELSTFFDFIKKENIKEPAIRLSDLLQIIRVMQEENIAIPVNKISYSKGGVNFVTAHSSKGLEFEYVFLISCNKSVWERSGRNFTYPMPENLVPHLEDGSDELEESRRLFYVAMTRAKHHLCMSYPEADNEMKDLERCQFLAELIDATQLQEQKVHATDTELVEYNIHLISEKAVPNLKMINEEFTRKILESYSLSVTHLNTYLRCPMSFYFKHLLRVPTAKNQYMAFGSAVHFALEQLFRKMQDSENKTFPGGEEFVSSFNWYMTRHRDSFTDDQFERRSEYGKTVLPHYYNYYVEKWNKIVSIERNFKTLSNGVPINGKLDKLEFDGKSANVVDYKTGQFSKAKSKLLPPVADADPESDDFEKRLGGDYWRQAVFYKILIDNDKTLDWKAISTEFDFIQPDDKDKFQKAKIHITENDIAIVSDQISTAYSNILDLNFEKGCNDKFCKWCAFVKSSYEHIREDQEEEVEV